MPKISEQQAKEILEKNGYKILDDLGSGAASYAFKASRKSKKSGEEKTIAVKVCCPSIGSWASLQDELRAAKELKKLKQEFKGKVGKDSKYFFKYLTVPKLKERMKIDGKDCEVAIFEAPLADSDLSEFKVEKNVFGKAKTKPGSGQDTGRLVISDLNIDYRELKRAIKSILKGLKAIHDQGMSHGDIKFENILQQFDKSKGKYRYSVTDFGTLNVKSGRINRKGDLVNVSRILLGLWLSCVGLNRGYVIRTLIHIKPSIDYYYGGNLATDGVDMVNIPENLRGEYKEGDGVYYPTDKDMELINFGKKLYDGVFKTADEALADPWLKKE